MLENREAELKAKAVTVGRLEEEVETLKSNRER
jgi:hypothetical protein